MMEMWVLANVIHQERLREAEEERLARQAARANRRKGFLRVPVLG